MSQVIDIQSTVCLKHMVGKDYSCLWENSLRLGSKVASLHGKNSVCDKMISSFVCAKIGLSYGFDDPVHAMGIHVDSYNPRSCDPVHYGGTQEMISEMKHLLLIAYHCQSNGFTLKLWLCSTTFV